MIDLTPKGEDGAYLHDVTFKLGGILRIYQYA